MQRPKMKSGSLKIALCAISLSLPACNSLPPFPEVVQYGYHADVPRPGFYGVNNKTHARTFRAPDDPKMKGAQCLEIDDYKKSEDWVRQVKELAETRCK
jgi:hypothetical protein